ncbi:MAG TPA: murein biosynthesis integral membrane protein MurJ [Bellilinea sp.]|nr:murein biosynthesis integral membrane protein MurJ [Bellilinea sp.]
MTASTAPVISPTPSASRQIARAAGTVMVAFIITQLLGLVRGFIIFPAFGTSEQLDSFNAANRVAELLFNLMAGGALGSAFIPTFTGMLTRENRTGAWKLASSIANLLLLVLTGIAVLAWVFAPQIVHNALFILVPNQPVGQEQLTVALLQTLLPTVVIFGLSGLVMGILNAHQKFWLPAIAPAMYSLGQILGVLLLPEWWGVTRLALGALAGALLHLLVQLPGLLRLKGKYHLMLGLRLAEVREVLRLMGPRILGVAVVQINFIVNIIIGISLPVGSVSALTLAFTWMLMPQTAIAQSIAIAAMPTFSAQAALKQWDELRHSLAASLRGVLLLAVPATVGLILLRTPLIQLYERNAFTAQSTQLVAWALLWYTIGLVGHSLLEVVVRAFYALHDTRTPVAVTLVTMLVNIGLSLTLPGVFARAGWLPLGGLALAHSLATTLECAILILLLARRLNGMEGPAIWSAAGQAATGAVVMGLALWGLLEVTSNVPPWLVVLLGVVAGAGIYAAVLGLLKVPELKQVISAVNRRISGVIKTT